MVASSNNDAVTPYQVGDVLAVRYLTDNVLFMPVQKAFKIMGAVYTEVKELYPELKEGDYGYSLGPNPREVRSFIHSEIIGKLDPNPGYKRGPA